MITEDILKKWREEASRIKEVSPCNDTLDQNGVSVLLNEEDKPYTYAPAFTRKEFINKFKKQTKIVLSLVSHIEELEAFKKDAIKMAKFVSAYEKAPLQPDQSVIAGMVSTARAFINKWGE